MFDSSGRHRLAKNPKLIKLDKISESDPDASDASKSESKAPISNKHTETPPKDSLEEPESTTPLALAIPKRQS